MPDTFESIVKTDPSASGVPVSGVSPSGTYFQVSNNLSEGDASTIRSNIGVVIGTDVQAWDAQLDTLSGLSAGQAADLLAITEAEYTQIQNIDSVTVSNTQWGYLGALDQALATTDDVRFNDLELTGTINYVSENNLQVEDKTITVNKGGTAGSAENAGLIVENPNGDDSILWDSTSGFDFSDSINVTGSGTFSSGLDVTGGEIDSVGAINTQDQLKVIRSTNAVRGLYLHQSGTGITSSPRLIMSYVDAGANSGVGFMRTADGLSFRTGMGLDSSSGTERAVLSSTAFDVSVDTTVSALLTAQSRFDVIGSTFGIGSGVRIRSSDGAGSNFELAIDSEDTLGIYDVLSSASAFVTLNFTSGVDITKPLTVSGLSSLDGGIDVNGSVFSVSSAGLTQINNRLDVVGSTFGTGSGIRVRNSDGTSSNFELAIDSEDTLGIYDILSSSSPIATFNFTSGILANKLITASDGFAVTGGTVDVDVASNFQGNITTQADLADDGFTAANGVFGDGSNYQIQSNGDAQFRNIVATGTLSVKEFIAKQISAIGGEEILSSGTGRVESNSVSGSGDNILETVTVTTEDSGSALNAFANGDLVAIRVVDINDPNNLSRVEFRVVQATSTDTVDLVVDTNYHSNDASPLIEGDFMVIYGNIGSGTTVDAYTASTAATATAGTDGRDSLIKRSVLGNPLVTLNSGISSYALGFGGSVNDTIEMAYGDLNGVVTGISSEEYGIVAGDVTLAGNHFLFTENQASLKIDTFDLQAGAGGFKSADIYINSADQDFSLGSSFYYDGSLTELGLTGTLLMGTGSDITNSAADYSITEDGIEFDYESDTGISVDTNPKSIKWKDGTGGGYVMGAQNITELVGDASNYDTFFIKDETNDNIFLQHIVGTVEGQDGIEKTVINGDLQLSGSVLTIADDDFARIGTSVPNFGMALVMANTSPPDVAAISFDNTFRQVVFGNSNSTYEGSGGVPSGTSGTDGKVTIFFDQPNVYIENRIGSSLDFRFIIMSD